MRVEKVDKTFEERIKDLNYIIESEANQVLNSMNVPKINECQGYKWGSIIGSEYERNAARFFLFWIDWWIFSKKALE